MGCDGGTIPRRDELVRVKKKPEKADKNAKTAAKWKHCAISQQPLQKPIVSCELGKIYNKIAVIEYLLSKDSTIEVAKHIRNLSDVKELNLTDNSGYKPQDAQKGDEYVDVNASQFICPVTGLEMNGKQKFCFFWKCGCVLSEKAIKEVRSDVCHKCGLPTSADDLIVLNGSDEEVADLEKRMEERRKKAKLERKKRKAAESTATSEDKKPKISLEEPSTSKVVNGSADKGDKPTKPAGKTEVTNGVSAKKLFLPKKALPEYSIAKDPKATSAFKSLFTSHETAKSQGKAHWITHNPLYY